ncbi:hypothetical protein DITRI_Ditri02bG0089100 [Diplodiscus trichospermus]
MTGIGEVIMENEDGGWGLHIEGPSTIFGTVLSYVTLRLLGERANDGLGAMERGRDWLLSRGGATQITSWGKMWLSVLNLTLLMLVTVFDLVFAIHMDICLIIIALLGGNRCWEPLNGLAIVPCPLRYGFFLVYFHSIQVYVCFVDHNAELLFIVKSSGVLGDGCVVGAFRSFEEAPGF